MATLQKMGGGPWHNFHRTVFRSLSDQYTVIGDPPGTAAAAYFDATAQCLRPLIAQAVTHAEMLTSIGTKWSFSRILDGNGSLLETDFDQAVFDVDASMLAPGTAIDPKLLVIASGGTKIATLNQHLEGSTPARSLRTSGSFDGQSIAGMIGTGVHGSALHCGPFQNHVRGVHLLTSDNRSVWIEPGPQPLFDPAFVGRFATQTILDSEIFGAALVHLGGLGIVNAVALEVRDALRMDIVRAVATLGARQVEMLANGRYRSFAASLGHDREPYYIEATFNPFSPFDDGFPHLGTAAAVTMYFETATVVPATPPDYAKAPDPLHDMLEGVETYIGAHMLSSADLIPPPLLALAYIAVARYEALIRPIEHGKTWGEACGAFQPRKIGNIEITLRNDAFAVPRAALLPAMRAVREAFPLLGGGHLVATVRFVSASTGTLAFTRFADSAVINLDGLITRASEHAVADTLANLDAAGIPFSQHWGKLGHITAARLIHEFGDPAVPGTALARWCAARAALLAAGSLPVFRNAALVNWGLA